MRTILLAFFQVILAVSFCYSQNTFSKAIYPEVLAAEGGKTIHTVSDGHLIYVNSAVSPEYTYNAVLQKINFNGEPIWRRRYNNNGLSIGPPTSHGNQGVFIHSAQSYYLSGSLATTDSDVDAYLMKVNASGDSLWMQTYGGPYYDPHGTVTPLNDSILLLFGDYGTGPFNQDEIWLQAVDLDGNQLWEHFFAVDYGSVAKQDIAVLDNGNIALLYYDCDAQGACGSSAYKRLRLAHLNPQGEELWTSTVLEVDALPSSPLTGTILELDNGNFLVSFYREDGFVVDLPSLYWVNTQGNVYKQYDFWEDENNRAYITDMFINSAGDIIGIGNTDYSHEGTFYSSAGWVFSMKQEGVLNWQRLILDESQTFNSYYLSAGLETPDGGYLFTGSVGDSAYQHSVTWLLKLDSLGCYEPGCSFFQIITNTDVSASQEVKEKPYRVYPNPLSPGQPILLEYGGGRRVTRAILLDGLGRVCKSYTLSGASREQLALNELPPAVYWLRLEGEHGEVLQVEKVLVLK